MSHSHERCFRDICTGYYIALIEVVVLGPIHGFILFTFWTEDNTCTLPLVVILWIQSFFFDKCVTHLSYDCQISISICGFIVGVVIVVDGSDVCF